MLQAVNPGDPPGILFSAVESPLQFSVPWRQDAPPLLLLIHYHAHGPAG